MNPIYFSLNFLSSLHHSVLLRLLMQKRNSASAAHMQSYIMKKDCTRNNSLTVYQHKSTVWENSFAYGAIYRTCSIYRSDML